MIQVIIKQLSFPFKKLSRYLFFKKRFKEIGYLLEDGSYFLNLNGALIVKEECLYISIDLSEKFGYVRKMFSRDKGNIFLGRVKNEIVLKSIEDFKGTYVLFSNKLKSEKQYGELKIFNLVEEQVLSTFNTNESFDKKLSNTVFFSNYFLIPKILHSNPQKLFLVEQLIDFHKPRPEEFVMLANYVLKSYQSYFLLSDREIRSIPTQNVLKYSSLEEGNSDTINLIASYINFDTLPQNSPYIYQHGDLSLSNILIDDFDRIYFIDFEHSGFFSFLYDVMWFWQNEAINNSDFRLIEHYFKGEFDEQLTELFLACNLVYNKSTKLNYLLMVVLEVIQNRVLKNTSKELPNHFLNNKVRPAIDRIVQIANFNE